MSTTHARLRIEVGRVAESTGTGVGTAAMMVMTLGVMAMARELPDSLRHALVLACKRWYADEADLASLEAASIDCWRYLENKRGNSTTIVDRADAAVRALLCVLWDQVPELDEVEMTLEFFAPLADRFESVTKAMGLEA